MFSVTFEIVTPESADHGDVADRGYITETCNLRDGIQWLFETRTAHCDGVTAIEADSYPLSVNNPPRWISVDNGMEFLTGARESRSIHFPDNITPSSAVRIARLLDCYGVAV